VTARSNEIASMAKAIAAQARTHGEVAQVVGIAVEIGEISEEERAALESEAFDRLEARLRKRRKVVPRAPKETL
jgi:Zn finger protein HypA/HybF involved in hydrogenase expression